MLLVLCVVALFYIIFLGVLYAPFVPSSSKKVKEILKIADLKRGQVFVDLGSGDGKVVMRAVKDYGVIGIGVELNILLNLYARFMARIFKLRNIRFIIAHLYTYDLRNAQVVYIFLFPQMMTVLARKIKKECKQGTLIIAHGFQLPGFTPFQQIDTSPFPTYFYRV